MATSGSTNFSINRNTLVKGALRLCGALAQGEEPTFDQIQEANEALNMMVKAWQVDGMPLWAIKEYTLTLTENTQFEMGLGKTINIDKPLKVIECYRHDSVSNIDVPVRIITRKEYNSLGNKQSTGAPIMVWYDPQNTYGVLTVYPKPDTYATTNYTLKLTYQRPYEDFDNDNDTPDFPSEWYDAVKYGLAVRLAGDYSIPLEDRKQLIAEANAFKLDALSFGSEEGSVTFMPDMQGWDG